MNYILKIVKAITAFFAVSFVAISGSTVSAFIVQAAITAQDGYYLAGFMVISLVSATAIAAINFAKDIIN